MKKAKCATEKKERQPLLRNQQNQQLNLKHMKALAHEVGLVEAKHDASSGGLSGQATVTLDSLLNLIAKSSGEMDAPEKPFYISKAHYRVDALKGYCSMQCRFEIKVLSQEWTTVKLFSNKVALKDVRVSMIEGSQLFGDFEGGAPPPSVPLISVEGDAPSAPPAALAEDAPLLEVSADDSSSSSSSSSSTKDRKGKEGERAEGAERVVACVSVTSKGQGLVCNSSGDYVVECTVCAPYETKREMGVSVEIPESSQSDLEFHVSKTNIEVKVEPSLTAATNEDKEGGATHVNCQVPPTTSLSIQWTEKIVETKEVKEKLPLTITAEQHTLHSIGEGMITTASSIDYHILNGSVSLLEIAVDDRTRLLNVSGQGVKRWELVEAKKAADDDGGKEGKYDQKRDAVEVHTLPRGKGGAGPSSVIRAHSRVLKVYLEYGVEDNYTFSILSELEMPGTSCQIAIPTTACVGGVKREKGYIGIEARTNVEVDFVQGGGMASIDTSELSPKVWAAASNPIILAYKFLDPKLWVELQVKKHDDVSVLIAVVEQAHVIITQTEEGRTLTKVVAKVRNTQQQFLRLVTPKDSCIWSTFVSGAPVKPARDKEGAVMVPLKKSSKADQGAEQSFTLEILYFQETKAMEEHGKLSYNLPTLDLPVNHLFVSIYLPKDHTYEKFTGGVKTTPYFSTTAPESVSTQEFGQRQAMPQQQMQMQSNAQVLRRNDSMNMAYEDLDEQEYVVPVKDTWSYGGKNRAAGVLPVKVEIPRDGNLHRFEQLLVGMNSKLALSVEYTKIQLNQPKSNGCCSRCVIL